MRIYLNVPYEDKEIAKQKGCWWDDYKKQWFIENPIHMDQYVRWMPNHLLAPTKSKPLKHEPFVNTKISSDRIKRINEIRRKKTRR
jgi:hypothetical protein